jgi:hypothetical protein
MDGMPVDSRAHVDEPCLAVSGRGIVRGTDPEDHR